MSMKRMGDAWRASMYFSFHHLILLALVETRSQFEIRLECILIDTSPRQFLALVEYESRKKKRAAKAASEYMDRFQENIDSSKDALKMGLANQTAKS